MKGGGPKCFSFEHLFFCQGCTPVFNPVIRPIDCIQMYPGSPLSLSSFSMSTMVSVASWLDSWNMMSSVSLAFHFVLFYFVLNRPKVIYNARLTAACPQILPQQPFRKPSWLLSPLACKLLSKLPQRWRFPTPLPFAAAQPFTKETQLALRGLFELIHSKHQNKASASHSSKTPFKKEGGGCKPVTDDAFH